MLLPAVSLLASSPALVEIHDLLSLQALQKIPLPGPAALLCPLLLPASPGAGAGEAEEDCGRPELHLLVSCADQICNMRMVPVASQARRRIMLMQLIVVVHSSSSSVTPSQVERLVEVGSYGQALKLCTLCEYPGQGDATFLRGVDVRRLHELQATALWLKGDYDQAAAHFSTARCRTPAYSPYSFLPTDHALYGIHLAATGRRSVVCCGWCRRSCPHRWRRCWRQCERRSRSRWAPKADRSGCPVDGRITSLATLRFDSVRPSVCLSVRPSVCLCPQGGRAVSGAQLHRAAGAVVTFCDGCRPTLLQRAAAAELRRTGGLLPADDGFDAVRLLVSSRLLL